MKRIALVLIIFLITVKVYSATYLNLKYLEKTYNASIEFIPEELKIKITKGDKKIKLILNYPFVIYKNKKARILKAPFTNHGDIFITKETENVIKKFLSSSVGTPSKIEIKEKKSSLTGIKDKKIKIIVIDPGHGGDDPGAIGPTGLKEKEVTLDVAKRVVKYLKNSSTAIKIFLTRRNDKFIKLKERAIFANNKKADLFVSIHCNASRNKNARGTRTFIYGRIASSKEAAEAAKLENKRVGIFEFLLNDLKKSAYEYLSIEAAGYIQHSLVKNLKLKWEPTERAPFYVLANTNMPSVLVEIAFISNHKEEKKLRTDSFRDKVAYSIAKGIIEYLRKVQ